MTEVPVQVSPGAGTFARRASVLLPPLIGGLLAVGFLGSVAPSLGDDNAEDAALGEGTASLFWSFDEGLVHCRDLRDAEACFAAAEAADRRDGRPGPRVAWLGNSQLHAVNQAREDAMTAPALLNRALDRDGVRLVTFSQPNANLGEHLVLYEYLAATYQPDVLVLPVVFDDTRETSVRAELAGALESPEVRASVLASAAGRAVAGSLGEADDDFAALTETAQDRSERALNAWLEEGSSVWALRPQLRGGLFLGLRQVRNSVFGIRPDSKRRRIMGPYQTNLDAYQATLASASATGVSVIVYVAPLRNDIEAPYDPAEYREFVEHVARIADAHGARFVDLEGLVPGDLWGTKQTTTMGGQPLELDFMHFQEAGHVLLSDTLYALVTDELSRADD